MTSSLLWVHMRSVLLMEEQEISETEIVITFWYRICLECFASKTDATLKWFLFVHYYVFGIRMHISWKKKPKQQKHYQPGRCTPLSHKCPHKQDWRSQIKSKTWAINGCMDSTANANSRAALQPAEARALQSHIFLIHRRTLPMIRVLWA